MRSLLARLALAICAVLMSSARQAFADETRSLTHDAALRLAAERNLALLVKHLERERLGAVADAARRDYLPELAVEAAVHEPVGQRQRAIETIATLTYASPYGQMLKAQATVISGISGNPQGERALTIDVSQALLRGGFYPGGAADLRQADLDVKIAREQFRAELNSLLTRVDKAYWDLALTREDLEIRRRSRDRARSQFEETRENIRRGLLAPGEIYVVEENVVNFDDLLTRAEENVALAQSALRRLLNLPLSTSLVTSSSIDASAVPDASEADSLGVASAKSPTVLAAKLAVERAKVGVGGDVRQALPQLDAFGSIGLAGGVRSQTQVDANGQAVSVLQPVPTDPDLRAGLRMSVPLYWGPDTARVRRARTEQAQRRLDLKDAEMAAFTAVRDASIRMRARRQRLELSIRIVELAQKKLEVERDKYKSGLSTLTDVVRFQRDLDNALSSGLRARVDVLTARTEMLAARGDLHESLQVSIR